MRNAKYFNDIRDQEHQKAEQLFHAKKYKEAIDVLLNKKYFKKEGLELSNISTIYRHWAEDVQDLSMQRELMEKSRKYLILYYKDRLIDYNTKNNGPMEILQAAIEKTSHDEEMEDEDSECSSPGF